MASTSFCFPLPLQLSSNRGSAVSAKQSRNSAVCVLEQESRQSSSALTTSDAVYRVLPLEVVNPPPPPPKHYTLPTFGLVLEKIFFPELRYELARKLGGIYSTNGYSKRMHVVTDYNAICTMLKDSETFRIRGSVPLMAKIFGDKTLVNIDGDEHSFHRGNMAISFMSSLMPFYFKEIRRISSEGFENLAANNEKQALLDPWFRALYTKNMICVTTGSSYEEYESFSDKLKATLTMLFSPEFGPVYDNGVRAREELYMEITQLIGDALLQQADVIERVRGYGEQILKQASREFAGGEVNFLIMYIAASGLKTGVSLEENDPREVRELVQRIVGLWFVGTVTTAPTSASASMILGFRSDLWDILRAEQDGLVADEQGDLEVKYEQLAKMPLLESFLLEVLRFYPTATELRRICSRDAEAFGYHIAKGDYITFDLAAAMRDERYYPDAESFKFDRFLRQKSPTPRRILTFGPAGTPHYCIGAQLAMILMKTTFGTLLRRYTLELDPRQSQEWSFVPDYSPKSRVVLNKLRRRVDI